MWLAVVASASLATASACQLGDGSCLRMSDCETGWQCVEGTCRTDEAPADGSAARREPPLLSVNADASDGEAADASSTDGESTDAASEQ
jgi:hypothetical protein